MEFYLAEDKQIIFYRNEYRGQTFIIALEKGEIIARDFKDGRPTVDVRDQQYIRLKECIGLLKKPERVIEINCGYCGHDHTQMNRNSLVLKVSSSVAESAAPGYVGGRSSGSSALDKDSFKLKVELSGHALKILKLTFGQQLKIGLTFQFQKCYNIPGLAATDLLTATSKMTIKTLTSFEDSCEGTIDLPISLQKAIWLEGRSVQSKLRIVAYLAYSADPKAEEVLAATKQILDDGMGTDMQIICADGNGVSCNSGFLIAQSEVLKSMMLSEMKERKSKKILMDDMTSNGVKAFLDYLYYRGIDDAEKNCGIAVELIKAGKKYIIESLERTMKDILMQKPFSWFEVDAALTLFFFASKIDAYDDLKLKTIQVLKAKPEEVQSSSVLNQIFREDVEAAKEIFQAVLWAWKSSS